MIYEEIGLHLTWKATITELFQLTNLFYMQFWNIFSVYQK